ncbi:MAG: hypothetical protein A3G49_06690 [Candidatus Sungbacteria bacterium RIFCSPLOWO2_12_FULL_41_11]|uniref:histidine kinase n=1 Tax=Candidatus Sungbacteria bacterium RIFCSPLOWO2_12_FULL_41_11 TaxID=1802286 RepID=A0A1G2LSL9_9BACT|nr:MAG: Histidine kinase [Parcubacteria group bacterium GW2011_GWA2_42_14]OGZ98946.1 MAG: hypothetical protein A3D41_04900 [Candidatus Sungbacteria bacterium RIFCSPHIGHO2_02_FULL_41_12b]OHA14504.1 MAG: hypothetical protein A3G49_06690 [Candidatus Sungbacteria bacterium RIFCSPLOWO2_12_FULL_41_11]
MTEKNNQLNEKVKSVNPVRTGVPRSADESITLPSAISTVTADPLRRNFSEASSSQQRSNGVNKTASVLKRTGKFRLPLFIAILLIVTWQIFQIEKIPQITAPWIMGGIIILFIIISSTLYFLFAPHTAIRTTTFEPGTLVTVTLGNILLTAVIIKNFYLTATPLTLFLIVMLVGIYSSYILQLMREVLRAEHETEETRQQYGKLLEIDREKLEFITTTSHQLRTPLTEIRWGLEAALQQPGIDTVARSAIEKSLFSINRLVKIVDQMLEAKHTPPPDVLKNKKEQFDALSLLEEITRELDNFARQKMVAVTLSQPDQKIFVKAEREKLKTSLKNIVDNAIRYSPNQTVNISLWRETNLVYFRVEDAGIGITPEDASHIFTRFFRGKNAKLLQPDGSGLGLSTAKNIIENQGGTVQFFSKPGNGTIFVVTIPS